ncbi:NAD-dependent epimerase/dehydratase family protein [Streptomyces sp. TRM 70361]|uniref:NAD-dependent epimerase/dehydratase family protein n=1 Tax=Streptomyces sp. TRM 70361 TaxID=3116553 RepID=UPI002E7B05DA|nr:NAD-dependent epimerase/dehydratase family protein [Streptomyces sp. TRM 70361]MEE1942097.1 NAD-dependent epimerase/dehydratase family protein [Streptomyces sp. TRM 70361]
MGTAVDGDSGTGGDGLRVVVLGATGNVGTSVVERLAADPHIASVLGLARRTPGWTPAKTEWASVDLGGGGGDHGTDGDEDRAGRLVEERLTDLFRGADAVVHLAWLIQPLRDPLATWRTNVLGTARVLRAVVAAEVPALVYASSVGAYSPGPKDRAVDESWPTHGGRPDTAYCREKAYVERLLDGFEHDRPEVRVVRVRPGFLFKEAASSEQRRLFAGPLVPQRLMRPGLLPVVPDLPGLRFQVLHTDDAAEAYRLAVTQPVHGAFNLAADPVVDAEVLAEVLGARVVRLPLGPVRAAVAAAWRLRLAPASPELFDAFLRLPLMDCGRAGQELGWTPGRSAAEALGALLTGMRERAGGPTPPLVSRVRGGRLGELATGVGRRS